MPLASGKGCSIVLPPEASIRALKLEVQQRIEQRFLRLLFGSEKLEPSRAVAEVGLQHGPDTITAVAQNVKLASNRQAFALYVDGGAVLTWGHPAQGGASYQVQKQLVRVQQIQGISNAFAAILHDGFVVTPNFGGDSSRVREQLVRIQQIQSTSSAFAAILHDGSVVTWRRS